MTWALLLSTDLPEQLGSGQPWSPLPDLLCSACVGVVGQTVGTALRAAAPGSPSLAEQPALAAECAHLKR